MSRRRPSKAWFLFHCIMCLLTGFLWLIPLWLWRSATR